MPQSQLVSVVMPAFNSEGCICDAIDSVRQQTYTQWELLVCNDGSTDNTGHIVESLATEDPRIRVFNHSTSQGVAATRNHCLREASGQYIAFLDSDDVWYPHKLARQMALMASGVELSYSGYHRMDDQGKIMSVVVPPTELDYQRNLRTNHIGNLTGIYNAGVLGKEYLKDCGHEDYVAWLKLLKRASRVKGISEPLAAYRVNTHSVSGNKLDAFRWQWKIYREQESLPWFQSLLLMVTYTANGILKRYNFNPMKRTGLYD